MTTYVNGRILLRDHGGVRRYASEVSSRLPNAHVLRPRSAKYPWSGRVWEQTTLAHTARDGVLLNMAHSGPVRHPNQVNVVHDLIALTDPRGVHPGYAALLRMQLPRYIASARQLVTVSEHVANQMVEVFDVDRSNVTIVPPGISHVFCRADRSAACRRLGLEPERPVIAALLDPTPRKNSHVVASLLREVQRDQPNVQVVVAGRSQPAAFARTRLRPGASVPPSNFVDLGAVADIELATMYQAADIFVSLSRSEGFGLPVVEAAMCGAAVVTTAVPSITEHAPEAALVVTNAKEAKRAIAGLLDDALRRSDLAVVAHAELGDLQWDRSAASLGLIMRQVSSV